MKTFVYVVLFCSMLGNRPLFAETKIPPDKAAHFAISATATTACALLGRWLMKNKWMNGGVCALTVNGIGVLKEISDPYYGRDREMNDIYADFAGTALSFFTISVGF